MNNYTPSKAIGCFTLVLLGALTFAALEARAVSGTSKVASPGQPVQAVPDWPEGALDLVNDPLRTDGWHPWFSGIRNDKNIYEFKVRDIDDVNRLVQKLAAIKAPKLLVRLNPDKEARALGYSTVLKEGNGTAILFSLESPNEANFKAAPAPLPPGDSASPASQPGLRTNRPHESKAAPTPSPPTLTLYVGHKAVDLNKLKIPDAVEVVSDAASAGKAPEQVVKAIEEFITNLTADRQSNSGKRSSAPVESMENVKLKPKKIPGRVTDEAGQALAKVRWQISRREALQDGQWVEILLSGEEPEFHTDDTGRFELPVSDVARCDLLFDREDRGPAFVFQVGPDRRELHVVMKPGIPVRATVVRADNQGPVRDETRVSLALANPRGLWYRKTQQVDHNGQVNFYASPAPTLPDRNSANSPRWQIECAGQSIPIDVREGEPVDVRVKVAVSADGSKSSSQQSASKDERTAVLTFLSDVPEFREFNLKLTEEKLKELINQHHLLANVFRDEDGKRSYRVFRSDGENVIIGFRSGECGGIQRMRRDVEGLAKLRASNPLKEQAGSKP